MIGRSSGTQCAPLCVSTNGWVQLPSKVPQYEDRDMLDNGNLLYPLCDLDILVAFTIPNENLVWFNHYVQEKRIVITFAVILCSGTS